MVFNKAGVASACLPVSLNEKGVASGAVGQSEDVDSVFTGQSDGVWPL